MNNQNSNADIEFLVASFEQNLNLIEEYEEDESIPPLTKEYIRAFLKQLREEQAGITNATEFLDYGTKFMMCVSKMGVQNLKIP